MTPRTDDQQGTTGRAEPTAYAWAYEWCSDELAGEGDRIASWAADTMSSAGITGDALYVATPDGGAREAIAFWSAARQTGYAFAAPAAFPWTLSNSPTGRISQRLAVTGPCATLVGDSDAVDAAYEAAQDDLRAGRATRAIVVWLRGDPPVRSTSSRVRVRLSVGVLDA